jgi:hypothetical protein
MCSSLSVGREAPEDGTENVGKRTVCRGLRVWTQSRGNRRYPRAAHMGYGAAWRGGHTGVALGGSPCMRAPGQGAHTWWCSGSWAEGGGGGRMKGEVSGWISTIPRDPGPGRTAVRCTFPCALPLPGSSVPCRAHCPRGQDKGQHTPTPELSCSPLILGLHHQPGRVGMWVRGLCEL